jgi:prefoldin subunit 5
MRERLEQRLEELRQEFAKGQQALVELGRQRTMLVGTLTRIQGAIQVLEELTMEGGASPEAPTE